MAKIRMNWFDTGYGAKPRKRAKAPRVERSQRRSPPRERVAPKPAATSAPPRVALPSGAFDALRDQAGWPDYERNWIRHDGKRWWPFLIMEHAMTVLLETKDLQNAREVVELVREGSPLDPGASR